MSLRHFIFLRDVLLFSFTAFGGAQAHFALMLQIFVERHRYLSKEELIELNALCQILPGPTSTQTVTAIGFRLGGPNLAYLTLLAWILPSVIMMFLVAVFLSYFQDSDQSLAFMRFLSPMVIGFIAFGAYRMNQTVVKGPLSFFLMLLAAVLAFVIRTPYVFPAVLIGAGAISALKFQKHPKEEKVPMKIEWANFILWAGVFAFAAILGHFTRELPVRLFENFYRNGSLIFGGGQALVPLLYTEFVEFKDYLTGPEFITGYGIGQALPGPTFSFTAFVGAMSMPGHSIGNMALGALVATAGIFLPGTFLIFFVIRFWDQLKRYRPIRASLEGINAASAGLVIAAAFLMFEPMETNLLNLSIIAATFCLLLFTRIPAPFIIITGIALGWLI